MKNEQIKSLLEQRFPEFFIEEKKDPVCTCRDDQKQRAICPVCDKEEYEDMKKNVEAVKRPSVNTSLKGEYRW